MSPADTRLRDTTTDTAVDVTVVVCTYRRPAKLEACLAALALQTIGDRAEVVVVDDGSGDATPDVARRHPVRLVRHERNRGLSAARNTGVGAARAPIVAFTDDDCIPAPDWLEHLLAAYDRHDAVGVGGTVAALRRTRLMHRYLADTNRLAPLESELGRSGSIPYRGWLYLKRNAGIAPSRPTVRAVFSIVGANMSFRRDALLAIGGFDVRITFGGEDEDICRRLRAEYPHRPIAFTADAVIEHDYEGHLRDTLRRSYLYGVGSARSYLKNDGQRPTLFPVPVVVALLACFGVRRRRSLAWALAAPLVVFVRWPVAALRRRSPALLSYPYIQLVEELAHDVGFARSWLRLRSEYSTDQDVDHTDAATDRGREGIVA